MRGRISGFRFDSRRQRAKFEVILPGTGATRRRRKTVSARTRDEALAKWKVWRERILGGEHSSDMTLAQYVDQIWPRTTTLLAAKTVKREEWILKRCLLPRLGSVPLRTIGDAKVRDLVGELRSAKYAAATVNGVIAALRKLLRDAWEREIIPSILVRRFPHEKEERLRLELSPDEQRRFLSAFDDFQAFQRHMVTVRRLPEPRPSPYFASMRRFGGSRHPESEAARFWFERFRRSKPVFLVALETGLTRGDLLGLRWASINQKEGLIKIERRKTGVEAVIPISNACQVALAECSARPVVGENVFLTDSGQPYSVSTLTRHFALAKRLAGIKRRLRIHDLRHSLASRLASSGVSLQVIAKVLGHSSVTTAERYARPNQQALATVLSALNSSDAEDAENSRSPTGQGMRR